MANTSSARKATRKIARRTEINKGRRSKMRGFVRKVEEAIATGDRAQALAALKEAGKLANVKVGGFDGSPDAVAAIKAGEMQYSVLQPVAVFSAEAVKQADNFIKTGKTGAATEKQLFDCILITPDNVDQMTGPFVMSE